MIGWGCLDLLLPERVCSASPVAFGLCGGGRRSARAIRKTAPAVLFAASQLLFAHIVALPQRNAPPSNSRKRDLPLLPFSG